MHNAPTTIHFQSLDQQLLSFVFKQEPCKRNGLKDAESTPSVGVESATSSKKAEGSRFTICKAHKASRRKKEKSSAKRERKATKTLAIVLGKI
jgi:hypothetical protein